jgi:hypothetical protein
MAQKSRFTWSFAWAGTLANMLRARWIKQRWRTAVEKTISMALIRPGAPSDTTTKGSHRPLLTKPFKNDSHASVDSPPAASRPTRTARPSVSRPQAHPPARPWSPGDI